MLGTVVGLLGCAACLASAAGDKPMNILVLYADDWRHDTLGVAGDPVVLTPHLDKLAGEGVRFSQNCVTTAICGVSRACLFTGQWRFDSPEKFQTMMKNYYRLASEVDHTCGRVLEELEKQGVPDNTLVIFTTDNGYYHAEHGLADKWYPTRRACACR